MIRDLNKYLISYSKFIIVQASTEQLLDSGLLADCGLLDPVHAPMVVDHLVSVYYPTKDKTIDAECPINWEELARTLLKTSGPKLTMELLRGAATCLKQGTFSKRSAQNTMLR